MDEGMRCYASMITDYMISIKSEHYTCMVNLLGHAGHLEEAEKLVMAMPYEPHVAPWMSLLSTCRIHGNVEMAEHVANRILEMEPDNAGYVLLSNIYAAAGNWHLCEDVEWQRKGKGVKKQPGCTWIEVNNKVHRFVAEDQDHLQMIEIQAELQIVNAVHDAQGTCLVQNLFCIMWKKNVVICVTIARNWLLHLSSSTQLPLILSKLFLKFRFVKIATLPQSSSPK